MAKPLKFKEFVAYEEGEVDEALDMTQRRKLAQRMKRNKSRIALGRKRAEKKIANMDTLKTRARKHARKALALKLTKDTPKSELSPARKKEIEKRLDKPQMQSKITRNARKILPKVRQAELTKKRGAGSK